MAKKSLGYVELQWTCTNCGTKNPGAQKTCLSCGMPQPEDVEFEQPAQEELLINEAKLNQAKAGPDIHCHYCGSRNPASAETCSQCGADLAEGTKRDHGQVLGAHRHEEAKAIECPACGTPNEADAPKCIQCGAGLAEPQPEAKQPAPVPAAKPKRSGLGWLGGAGLVILALLCAAAAITYFVLAGRTEDITGTVDSVNWSRSVAIEGLVPVEYEAWHDEIPAEGVVGTCVQKVRGVQNDPAPNSREVCGTPYTVDSGSGFGEVVQDCKYEILEDFCGYTVDQWRQVDSINLSGEDLAPHWPDLALSADRRAGDRTESYRCIFKTEDGVYTFSTSDESLYNRCAVGSRWNLKINTFGAVNELEPAN
jgi:ribosomal protein L40E